MNKKLEKFMKEEVIDMLIDMTKYDVKDILKENGSLLKPLEEMGLKERMCISSIDTTAYGKEAVPITHVHLVDKLDVIRLLNRIYRDKDWDQIYKDMEGIAKKAGIKK